MLSTSFLCCYRVLGFEQHTSSLEQPGDDSSRHSKQIDHAPTPVCIEAKPSLFLADTEPLRRPRETARKSSIDMGMGTGRGRLHGDTRRLPCSAPDITRQRLPGSCTSRERHYSTQSDGQSIVSDPSALYLAPLIRVSSIGTEVQATSPPGSPEVHDTDRIRSPGSTGTIAPCPVTEERACTDDAVAADPLVHKLSPVECDAKSIATTSPEIIITLSKPEPIVSDDEPWSPFDTWLLAQAMDSHSLSSLSADVSATPSVDTTPVSGFHHQIQPLEGELSSLGPVQDATGIIDADSQVPNKHHSTWIAQDTRQRPRRYATDGAKYPYGTIKPCRSKDSSYLTVPETSFGPGRLGRRSAQMPLSSWDDDERACGVHRSSDRSSYRTAVDTMPPSRRGMSNSSCHSDVQAEVGLDDAFAGNLTAGSFHVAAATGSKEGPSTSYLPIPVGTGLGGGRGLKKRPVRSKFREEFGEVLPRPGILSKLRVFSGQGRTASGSKRTGEVVTNHIFLSDHDPKDAQVRRDMFLHGCLQAAGNPPKRRPRTLHSDGACTYYGFSPGEIQPVNGPFPLSDGVGALYSGGMSTSDRTGNGMPATVSIPPRALNTMPRVSRGSLIRSKSTSFRKRFRDRKRLSESAGSISSWADLASYRRDMEPGGRASGGCVGQENTTDPGDSASKRRGLKRGLSSARLLLSGKPGARRKSQSSHLSFKTASIDVSEDRL